VSKTASPSRGSSGDAYPTGGGKGKSSADGLESETTIEYADAMEGRTLEGNNTQGRRGTSILDAQKATRGAGGSL